MSYSTIALGFIHSLAVISILNQNEYNLAMTPLNWKHFFSHFRDRPSCELNAHWVWFNCGKRQLLSISHSMSVEEKYLYVSAWISTKVATHQVVLFRTVFGSDKQVSMWLPFHFDLLMWVDVTSFIASEISQVPQPLQFIPQGKAVTNTAAFLKHNLPTTMLGMRTSEI